MGTLYQQIPHTQHGKTGLDQCQEHLIDNQKLLKRQGIPSRDRPRRHLGSGGSTGEAKDEQTLRFQLGSNPLFVITFNLAVECAAVGTSSSVRVTRHSGGGVGSVVVSIHAAYRMI